MKHLILISVPDSGQISDFKKKEIGRALNEFRGKNVMLTIERKYNKRSLDQNEFYWSGFIQSQIDCFYENWGEKYTKEEMHTWNKNMFWADEIVIGDEIIKKPATSTKYSTVQWEERLEIARQWFWKVFEWHLPFPKEQTKLNYKD